MYYGLVSKVTHTVNEKNVESLAMEGLNLTANEKQIYRSYQQFTKTLRNELASNSYG